MADVKEALVYVIPINNRFWSRRGLYRKKKKKKRINKLVIYSNVLVESSRFLLKEAQQHCLHENGQGHPWP
jgi:hypothetical protein